MKNTAKINLQTALAQFEQANREFEKNVKITIAPPEERAKLKAKFLK